LRAEKEIYLSECQRLKLLLDTKFTDKKLNSYFSEKPASINNFKDLQIL